MPRVLVPLLVLVALTVGAWLLFVRGPAEGPVEPSPTSTPVVTAPDVTSPPSPAAVEAGRREVVAAEVEVAPADPFAGAPESFRRALGALVGRIVDADGAPQPGVSVALYGVRRDQVGLDVLGWFEEGARAFEPKHGATTTDGEGRFRFTGVFPVSMNALGIDLRGPRATARFVDRVPNPGQTADLGDIVLERTVTLLGRVVDPGGDGVGGARVRATNLPRLVFDFGGVDVRRDTAVANRDWRTKAWEVVPLPAWASALYDDLPIPETTTTADGTFEVDVPLGLATIVVNEDAFVPAVHGPVPTGGSGGTRDVGTITLDEGDVLVGRVVDTSGAPVVGAELRGGRTFPMASLSILNRWGRSGGDGSFRVHGLPDQELLVAARREGAIDWAFSDPVEPGIDEPVVTLPVAHHLEVVARGPGGFVVDGVELLLRETLAPAEVPILMAPHRMATRQVPTDEGGVRIERLGAAEYDLLVRAAGYAVGHERVDLSAGPQRVEVELVPAHSLIVRVLDDASGAPIEWARVSAHRRGEWTRNDFVPLVTRRTDASGRAELVGLRAEEYELRVEHPAYGPRGRDVRVPDTPGAPVEFRLGPGGVVFGRVHMGGQPPDAPRLIVVGTPGDEMPRMTVTDLDGAYRVEGLPFGGTALMVFERFTAAAPGALAASAMREPEPERKEQFRLLPGDEKRVDFDLLGLDFSGPAAQLRGRVFVNDVPAAGLGVSYSPSTEHDVRRTGETDASGAFDLGFVPATKGWLRVRRREGGSRGTLWNELLTFAPNDVRDLAIRLVVGSVRGRVVLGDTGRPAAGVRVSASCEIPQEGGKRTVRRFATTDEGGRFVIADVLVESKTRLWTQVDGYPRVTSDEFEVPARGEAPEVVLTLLRGVTVSGVVRLDGVEGTVERLFMRRAEGGGGTWSPGSVDPETGAFKLESVLPGDYLLFLAGVQRFENLELTVPPNGVSGVVLVPVPLPPDDG